MQTKTRPHGSGEDELHTSLRIVDEVILYHGEGKGVDGVRNAAHRKREVTYKTGIRDSSEKRIIEEPGTYKPLSRVLIVIFEIN